MATLVTGGTGFVGSNIIKALAQRGHEVVSLDLSAPSEMVMRYLEPWASQVSFSTGSILEPGDLRKAVEGRSIDKVVHAAVFTATREDIEKESSLSIVSINVVGTTNVLELASSLPLRRFLYVSSGAVYGEARGSEELLGEDVMLYPRTLYASTKYASELLTRRYGEMHGFPSVSVRLASPYGPMERITGHRAVMSVLYECTGKAARGEAIPVGDRSLGRDYTYVSDTAAGICNVLDATALSHDVYNITTGRKVTLGDVVDALQEVRPGLSVYDDPAKVYGNLYPGYVRGILDGSRLQQDTGWQPVFDLSMGLADYMGWRDTAPFLD